MRDIDRALADIGMIRDQIARQQGFQSYGPATIALTGLLASAVAIGQWLSAGKGAIDPTTYFTQWIVAAIVSIILVGAEAATRSRRTGSRLANEMILAAAMDFLPIGLAGAALLVVLYRYETANCWMLPGLWQILVGLGMFALSRSLPRMLVIVGGWYLTAGFVTLVFGSATHNLSPWAMGIPFAIGQLTTAVILYSQLERTIDVP